jgi:hypothetical protein
VLAFWASCAALEARNYLTLFHLLGDVECLNCVARVGGHFAYREQVSVIIDVAKSDTP